MRWGLDRVRALLAAVGHPEGSFHAVHVGGTNGKGSVAAFVEGVLRADGRRTGLYTSPHLFRVEERIRIDGRPAPAELLESCATRLLEALPGSRATYFEAMTALGFLAFREAGVEWAAVEVGLGGRLDATNVLVPEACALTSLSLEHTEYLGDTLATVAAEKAGILKAGVPVAIGPVPEKAAVVMAEVGARVGAPTRWVGREAKVENLTVGRDGTSFEYVSDRRPAGLRVRVPLAGVHQAFNAATAILTLDSLPLCLSDEVVRFGLEAVRWRGRFEVLERPDGTWIVDVAHNPAAMASLLDTLCRVRPPRPRALLFAVLADKDWRSMLALARHEGLPVVLTSPPGAPPERRWEPAAAMEAASDSVVADFGAAMARARELAGAGTVVVCGSFHTAAEALRALDAAD